MHPISRPPQVLCDVLVVENTGFSGRSTADGATSPGIINSPPQFEQTCRTPILEFAFPTRSRILVAACTSEILRSNRSLAATRHLGWVVSGPCHVSESDTLALFSQIVHQSHAWSEMVIQHEVRSKPDQPVRYR